jgi:cell division protein FtsB
MARTTSTQRGASRRSAPSTARSGSKGRSAPKRAGSTKASMPAKSRGTSARRTAARPAGPWVPVLVVALVAVLGWSLYPALRLQYQASRRQAGLEQQFDSLRQRNEKLRAQVAELKTSKGVEKAAREDLGYAKAGEHVYVVTRSPSSSAPSSGAAPVQSAQTTGGQAPSVVRTLLDALFGVQQQSDVRP